MLKGVMANVLGFIIFASLIVMLIAWIENVQTDTIVKLGRMFMSVHSAEFANNIRARLSDSNGLISYDGILRITTGLNIIGFTKKKTWFREVLLENTVSISGKEGRYAHEIFVSISRDFYPIRYDTTAIMRRGQTYLVNVYFIEKNIVVDVYPGTKCSESVGVYGYRTVSCSDMAKIAGGSLKEVRSVSDMGSIMNSGGVAAVKIMTAEDIIPKDIVGLKKSQDSRYQFGITSECSSGYFNRICFRIVGDFVSPAILHTEISEEENFYGG